MAERDAKGVLDIPSLPSETRKHIGIITPRDGSKEEAEPFSVKGILAGSTKIAGQVFEYISPYLEKIQNFLGLKEKTDTIAYAVRTANSNEDAIKALTIDDTFKSLNVSLEQLSRLDFDNLLELAKYTDSIKQLSNPKFNKLGGAETKYQIDKLKTGVKRVALGEKNVDVGDNGRPIAAPIDTLGERLKGIDYGDEVANLAVINKMLTDYKLPEVTSAIIEDQEYLKNIETLLNNMARATASLTESPNRLNKMALDETKKAAEKFIGDAIDNLDSFMTKLFPKGLSVEAKKFGEDFSKSFSDSTTTLLKGVFSGKVGFAKGLNGESSFLATVGNTLLQGITDAAVEGITAPFKKEASRILTKITGTIFDTLKDISEPIAKKLFPEHLLPTDTKPIKTPTFYHNYTNDPFEGILPNINDKSTDSSNSGLSITDKLGNDLSTNLSKSLSGVSESVDGDITNLGSDMSLWLTDSLGAVSDTTHTAFGSIVNTIKSAVGAIGQLAGVSGGSSGSGISGGLSLISSVVGLFGGISAPASTGASLGSGLSLGGSAGVGDLVKLGRFADGGFISGPGSSISDSIPSLLSNGEFVVKASVTSRNRGLLEALNSGKVPKFAAGGIVGNAGKLGMIKDKSSNSAIFNINISGDVSRQTRAEVQKMIPQIATGVNAHNYEQGIRAA